MVAEPAGAPVEGDHDSAVKEPVELGRGDGGVAEDFAPGSDGPVRGDHDRRFQVALVDDLEQRRRGLGGQRQILQSSAGVRRFILLVLGGNIRRNCVE